MISVIIPALDEEKYIGKCLEAFSRQTFKEKFELIVVDNNSKDKTKEIAQKCFEKFSDKFVGRVIVSKDKGIGTIRKIGAREAKGDFLCFTDADTIVCDKWLERINKNLKKYSFSTGPVLFYRKTFSAELLRLWRKIYLIFHIFDFYWTMGHNMAIRKDAYKLIKGHRDFSLLEDFDISLRACKSKDVSGKYDKEQKVYTSPRRISNLLTYILIYSYGFYNYHFSKDTKKLIDYPKFDKMDLKSILKIISKHKGEKFN